MPWNDEPHLPIPRTNHATAVEAAPPPGSSARIYVVGGFAGDAGWTATGAVYDTQAHSWSPIAPMAQSLESLAATSTPGRLHVVGGAHNPDTFALHSIYEPASDTWTAAAPMPTARWGLAAVTDHDGHVHAIGGAGSSGGITTILGTVEAYDPATDTWVARAPMPTPRFGFGAVTGADGLIYAIGGWSGTDVLPTVETYDPAADAWTTGPWDLPSASVYLAAAVGPNGLIYAIGGQDYGENTLQNVYSYDPATPSKGWAQRAPLPTARAGLGAATGVDGLVYAIGGYHGYVGAQGGHYETLHDTVEAYTFALADGIRLPIDILKKLKIGGTSLGGIDRGGSGGIVIGKHFIPIPPHSQAMATIVEAATPYVRHSVEHPQLIQLIQNLPARETE